MLKKFSDIFAEWESDNPIVDKDQQLGNKRSKYKIKKVNTTLSIDLHGLTKDEALVKLKCFIRDNRSNQVVKLKIIHGIGIHSKGKRVLKDAVKEWLKENTHIIRNFRPGRIGEGSGGVTIAYIKAK